MKSLSIICWQVLRQTAITFSGQNYGAHNFQRCKQATRVCLILAEVITMTVAALMLVFAWPICSLFTTEAALIELAIIRIRVILTWEWINIIIEVLSGSLRGLGRSTLPAVITMIFICGVRIIWVFFVFPQNPTLQMLLNVYPVSWICTAIPMIIVYRYVTKKIEIEWNV